MKLREQLRKVWEEVLGKSDFSDSDCIMDIGGDSMAIYKICAICKEKYERTISPMDIFMYPSINSYTDFVLNGKSDQTSADAPNETKIMKRRMHRK